jgi:hypothetical protein
MWQASGSTVHHILLTQVMKASNAMDRLAGLLHHEDTAIVSKVNGIRNMLMFL